MPGEQEDDAEFGQLLVELDQLDAQKSATLDRKAFMQHGARRYAIYKRLIALLSPKAMSEEERKGRKAIRIPCSLAASIRQAGEPAAATAEDISCGGTLLRTDFLARVGAEVTVMLKDEGGKVDLTMPIPARVAWTKGGRLGVSFVSASEGVSHRIVRLVCELKKRQRKAGG